MRRATDCLSSIGFTLVEMVVVIAITGILAALLSVFGRTQIEAYFDVASRTALADAADTALRRIGRDLQAALPNSVRVAGGGTLLEFVPVKDAGRYRAEQTQAGTGDPLDLTASADTFDVLGPPVAVASGDQLVIYNLGISGSDVYEGKNRQTLTTTGASLSSLGFSGGNFPFGSPQHRFQIVGGPVSYECAPPVLRRHWCYAYQAGGAQPTAFGSLGAYSGCAAEQSAILADNLASCSISYAPGVLARNGLVTLRLTLASSNGESVTLMHQVDIQNSP